MVKNYSFQVKISSQLIQILMGKISGVIREQQERSNLCKCLSVCCSMYEVVSPEKTFFFLITVCLKLLLFPDSSFLIVMKSSYLKVNSA